MAQAKLPLRFTCYALQYSMYVKNCMSHPDETHTSPYKLWYRVEPDLSKLQPFGCKVTTLVHKDKRKSSYAPRGASGIFLSYNRNTLYWVYQDNCVVSCSDLVFHATKFTGTHTSREISDQSEDTDDTEDMGETASTPRYDLRPQAGPSTPNS
ncbi:hypothetical protein HDU77_001117, partial [Chytriomyces hyalinus]